MQPTTPQAGSFMLPALVMAATLAQRIEAIGKAYNEADTELVAVSEQVFLHFHVYGDATLATRLVNVLPESVWKTGLVRWLQQFAPLQWSEKTQSFSKDKRDTAKPHYQVDSEKEAALKFIQEALSMPFYKHQPQPKVGLFDEKIEKSLKSLESAYKKAKQEGLVQQGDKINAFMEKIRVLRQEAEAISASVDESDKKRVLETVTATEEDTSETIDVTQEKAA